MFPKFYTFIKKNITIIIYSILLLLIPLYFHFTEFRSNDIWETSGFFKTQLKWSMNLKINLIKQNCLPSKRIFFVTLLIELLDTKPFVYTTYTHYKKLKVTDKFSFYIFFINFIVFILHMYNQLTSFFKHSDLSHKIFHISCNSK